MKDRLKSLAFRVPFYPQLHSWMRGTLQERQAARSLARYQRLAAEHGHVAIEGAPLREALRARLAGKSRGRWPRGKGDLHIFLAYYVSSWESILPRALAPFGRVTSFNWRERGFDDRRSDWLQRRDEMNRCMLEEFTRANRDVPIDAVVGCLSGYTVSPEILARMGASAVIFNFCWDDRLWFPGIVQGGRFRSPAALAHVVDLNLTNASDSVVKYAVHGGLAMFWPEAAHPDVHRPHDVPFDIDVSFAGGAYGLRIAFVRALRQHGIRVECFGSGWPNGPLTESEMVRLYSRSRINLGFSTIGYCRNLMCLKGRDFEVPMSGGLYLTGWHRDLERVFRPGVEIAAYRSELDCVRWIRRLLADRALADAIRGAGRARCLRDHTYERRYKDLLGFAGLLESPGST